MPSQLFNPASVSCLSRFPNAKPQLPLIKNCSTTSPHHRIIKMSHEDHPPQRNTLLDKQLMNISATLVNASRRRDEQIRQRRLGQPAKETMSIANANLERKTARTTEVNGADQKALTAAQNDIESFRREYVNVTWHALFDWTYTRTLLG